MMDKAIKQALRIDQILELIPAETEFFALAKRNHLHNVLPPHQPEEQYARLSLWMELFLADQTLAQELRSIISQFMTISSSAPLHDLGITDFFEIKAFLYYYNQLASFCQNCAMSKYYELPDLQELFELLDPEDLRLPSFRLSPAYSPLLRKQNLQMEELQNRLKICLAKDLEAACTALDMPGLKYELVVSRAQTDKLQKLQESGYYIRSGENIANLTFKLADSHAASTLKAELSNLQQDLKATEHIVMQELEAKLREAWPLLGKALKTSLQLAWHLMLSDFAFRYDCCIPQLNYDYEIELKSARNLPVQINLQKLGMSYQPLDLLLNQQINVITGPNMGGKTTILECIGQFACLVLHGIPLPAKRVRFPYFESIWFNHDTREANLSSFGREIVSLANQLSKAGKQLLLLDEYARGTNPMEAEAISTALLDHLKDSSHFVLAATHFSGPASLEAAAQFVIKGLKTQSLKELLPSLDLDNRLKILSEAMDYSLVAVDTDHLPPLAALDIAQALGFDPSIITKARNLLAHNKDKLES